MGVPLDASSPGGVGDMFLLVKGEKFGLIKGEAQDDKHKGEIDVLGWSWGMEANVSFGGTSARSRPTIRELKVIKHVDSASTGLMTALRQNEAIVKAVLTLRKAGKTQLEYLKITIEDGRVTGVGIEAETQGPQVVENITFTFNKITVEYVPQGKDGQALGGMMYVDQFSGQQ